MEEKWIEKVNGSIINERVGGNISVKRSFGDFKRIWFNFLTLY